MYDFTWKDMMYVLGQTLTPDSKTRVLGKAVAFGDEWLGNWEEKRQNSHPHHWESGDPIYRA